MMITVSWFIVEDWLEFCGCVDDGTKIAFCVVSCVICCCLLCGRSSVLMAALLKVAAFSDVVAS